MVGGEITMRFFKFMMISLNEKRIPIILAGVLLTLALFLQPCFAEVPVSYTVKNQAGMPLDTWNFAKGDYLTFNTTTAENIVLWEWNVDGEKRLITVSANRNQTFGPFDHSPITAFLNVTDNTADKGSSVHVLQLNDGSDTIGNAKYSAVPDYFDGSTGSKLGTITFYDKSISKLEPEEKLDYWWWNVTNLSDGRSVFFEGQNCTEPIPMSDTEFSVKVTVKNGPQGFLLSYGGITKTLPDELDLIPNLSVIPKTGIAPLEISVIDQAQNTIGNVVYDVPVEYKYRIGNLTTENVFGKEFTEKNLNITLPYPGVYYVNQTITNQFGITKVTNITNITAYPFRANFTATPSHGTWPLTVSFIDQSVLEPISLAKDLNVKYYWEIRKEGDDRYFEKMDGKNPNFTFSTNGTYNVSMYLTLGDINSKDVSMKIYVTDSSEYPDLTLNASFSAVPQFGNPPLTVTFVDTSRKNEPVTYEWDFDDGSPIETIPNVTHVFGTPRLVPIQNQHYNVTLKIVGLDSGRTSEYRQLITVQPFNADFSEEVVSGTKMRFTDNSSGFPTQWFWLFGDGFTSRDQNPEHDYLSSGTYSVTLHAWNELRKDLKTKEIVVP